MLDDIKEAKRYMHDSQKATSTLDRNLNLVVHHKIINDYLKIIV
jgi:hypothetical protein